MQFKFLTLNLWRGGVLMDKIIAFIKKENPDILALQEVYDGSLRNGQLRGKDTKLDRQYRTIEVFKTQLPYKYFFFSPAFLDHRKIGTFEQGNALFSRYPIISTKTNFYDIPYGDSNEESSTDFSTVPRNLQHSVIRLGKINLNVFNTQGIWGFDGRDNEKRLKMSKIIIREIMSKKQVILAGDFNVFPGTKTIKNIEKHLINVFADELTSTFNTKRKEKGEYATSVVDMIFVSREIKIQAHYCPSVDISDHLPLVCLLRFT